MKKILYFVVEKEVDDSDSLNGLKTITVYEIIDNTPKLFATIDCNNEDNSKDKISSYLNDNGFGDDEIYLKQL